jgi:hypothetical protein
MKIQLFTLALVGLSIVQVQAQTESNRASATVASAQVLQDNNYTGRGNKNETVLHAVITTQGDAPIAVSQVKFNLNGTTNLKDIKSVKIYNTGSSKVFDSRKPTGELLAASKSSKGDITAVAKGTLKAGENHIWLTVDIAEKAREGNKVDASLISIKTANQDYRFTNGNPDGSREILLRRVLVLAPGDYGSKNYRIPAIITADDKSLVILTDKRKFNSVDLPEDIDVIAQRSTDNGKTWSEPVIVAQGQGRNKGFGDVNIIKAKSGKLVALYVGGVGLWNSTAENPQGHYVSVSTDNGKTWSAPRDITSQLYGAQCSDPVRKTWQSSFFGSGQGLTLRDGRIMAVVAVRETLQNHKLNNYVVYSDDEGETWHVSQKAIDGGDEAKVVELNDGTVLLSSRITGNRLWTKSTDRGETWGPKNTWEEIWGNACDADIIRYTSTLDGYDKNRILHTLPNAKNRTNVTMWVSYDEAATWPVKKTISKGESAYSSVTILPDGTIGVYVEEDESEPYKMYFLNFSLDWLTDSKDSYKKPAKK